ncbi:MAG: YeeE/YedE thiosulfate transporter family protein [Burkholderiaceae bacterium]|nr:YeeE/YedE thiosulfate transporter family protein [Burkholderiaceae bacterium]
MIHQAAITSALLPALALLCAALIGFAAHRGSLCNVRAVAEIMTGGSAHILSSLVQAALWVTLLTGLGALLMGLAPHVVLAPRPAAWALLGGILFGMGAALNGGCSLSTLHRLADGDAGMLASLAGFVLGVLGFATTAGLRPPILLAPVASVWERLPSAAPWLLAGLLVWALTRLRLFVRLARQQPQQQAGARIARWLLAPSYHLSVAAAVMGLSGGILYATQGAWSYTSHLRTTVLHATGDHLAPSAWHGALLLALIVGMGASALQRHSIRWRRPASVGAWLRHAAGGALMGAGAAMVPGGNDTLLLNNLPTLTLQAIAAYAAMLAGIAGTLWWMQSARLPMPALACTAAGCIEPTPLPQERPHEKAAHDARAT